MFFMQAFCLIELWITRNKVQDTRVKKQDANLRSPEGNLFAYDSVL